MLNLPKRRPRFAWTRSRRRGAVLALLAVCLVPLICVLGMVLDGGLMMARQRHVQAAADAAAQAAGGSIYSRYLIDTGLDPLGRAAAAGRSIASSNGYTNDSTTNTVTINIPPSSASPGYAGKLGCAEAIIVWKQPRLFSAIFGSGAVNIKARAVSQVKGTPVASILLTDPSMPGALSLTGGAKLTTSAGIQVNSNSKYNASTNPNGGAVIGNNGAFMDDQGGMTIVGNYNIPSWANPSTFFSKTPTTGQSSMTDPYASVATPTAAGLTVQPGQSSNSGQVLLYPGIYNGGLTLGGGATITMMPGLYYMKGGSFSVANGVKLTGLGVTIYLDSGGGAVSFQGGASITLSAPTTGLAGGVPGIVLFQDRANTTPLNNIANGAKLDISGTIYAPNSAMTIAGGVSSDSIGSQFIVRSLNVSNGVKVTINTPTTAGGGVAKPILSE